jgi:hypothetical protein
MAGEATGAPDPSPARTALAMLAMTATVEQLGTVENGLIWAAKNRLAPDTYTHALDELRLVLEAVEEGK